MRPWIAAALALLAPLCACSAAREGAALPWEVSGSPWRADPVWHDGMAEVCTYEATLEIYGEARRYTARAYTNSQHMDEALTTKSPTGQGLHVFKHHVSERVPTERYDYRFSIATFTAADDLVLFKLARSSQEDCGASFTQLQRDGAVYATLESGYLPGERARSGTLEAGFVAFDQLPLLLRDFPFDAPAERRLLVLPTLRTNRLVPLEPEPRVVRHAGAEELDLPIGRVPAHRLELARPDGTLEATFWFHADGGAPWLHVLVALDGPGGSSYRLASHGRERYWERP